MQVHSEIRHIATAAGRPVLNQIAEYINDLADSGVVVLRWGLVERGEAHVLLELALVEGSAYEMNNRFSSTSASAIEGGIHIALIIPTGVGAEIGGYIGDAGPVVKLLEQVADTVLVHPNVVNGADFFGSAGKALYVDGLTLDRFLLGHVAIGPPRVNRVGLLCDRLDDKSLNKLLNAANAMRAVHGVNIIGYTLCRTKLQAVIQQTEYGHFNGSIRNAGVLLEAADELKGHGAQAIAVVSALQGIPRGVFLSHYTAGGVNPIGAVEALISRLVTLHTGLPCAHAPAEVEDVMNAAEVIDPRAAPEVASGSGLPCVLLGLAHSPHCASSGGLRVSDLTALCVPESCAGGVPALAAAHYGIPILGVRANRCAVGVKLEQLEIPSALCVESYAEASAWLICQRAGITWESLQRPLKKIQRIG